VPITILEKTDLLSLEVDMIAHGVNCQGVMGAGVALAIRNKYPDVFKSYTTFISAYRKMKISPLGMAHLWQDPQTKITIANLFTQDKYGRDPKIQYASYEAIQTAFHWMFLYAKARKMQSIAMPKIGCNLGNAQWDKVLSILTEEYEKSKWTGELKVAVL